MQSFLSERPQAIRISGVLYSSVTVTPGVIQGSSLGCTLFAIFIDSLLVELDISASAYADDLKFIANLAHHRLSLIQVNFDRIYDWSVSRGMPLSVETCLEVHLGNSNPRHAYQCGNIDLPRGRLCCRLGCHSLC